MSFVPGVLRSLQFSNAIPSNSLILMGKVVTDSQGINFVVTGAGSNLIDHSVWSMFISDEVAAEWAYTVSWPLDLENSIWRKHGDLFQTFF